MANIQDGDTIQASWFITDTDGRVRKDKLDLEQTSDPLLITQNGQTLLTLGVNGSKQGDLKVDGSVEADAGLN